MTENTKKLTRRFLLTAGPLAVLLVAGWFYFTGGRYISTENAYIKTDIVSIVPEVSGLITDVAIRENQLVNKGDLLFTVEKTQYEIALEKARADLASAATQVRTLQSRYGQKLEEISMAQTNLELAQKNYDRRSALQKKNSSVVSPEEMDEISNMLQNAQTRIALLKEELAETVAALNGDPQIPMEEHPLYKAAKAALAKAELDFSRTEVRAQETGLVHSVPHKGDYAQMGLPALNIAVAEKTWVEANYKETELTTVKPGQPAEIEIDTYPGRTWHGTVESISPATESEFSILPAQNATGNWVKVVQRIPVRIAIASEAGAPQLRAGMSTQVTIDTGNWPHLPGFVK